MGCKMLLLVVAVCCRCSSGRQSNDEKIYAGTAVTDIREVPWMISVQALSTPQSQGIICGGTLVTTFYVITACHCLFSPPIPVNGAVKLVPIDLDLNLWHFIAGSTILLNLVNLDLTRLPPDLQIRKPSALLHHPECGNAACPGCYLKDLGLARMIVPFTATLFVQPLEITLDLQAFNNRLNTLSELQQRGQLPKCTVSGWGLAVFVPIVTPPGYVIPTLNLGVPNQLKTMTIADLTVNLETCIKWHAQAYQAEGLSPTEQNIWEERQVLPGDICTLGVDTGKGWTSLCSGDSGGGLICSGIGPKLELFGSLSFGGGCGSRVPKAFQTLGSGMEWLKSEMCQVTACQHLAELHPECPVPPPETVKGLCSPQRQADSNVTEVEPLSSAKMNRFCMWAMIPILHSFQI